MACPSGSSHSLWWSKKNKKDHVSSLESVSALLAEDPMLV
jgi:hypothetical protein